MKKILLIITLLFCLTGCVAQKPVSDTTETTQEANTEEKTIQNETTTEDTAITEGEKDTTIEETVTDEPDENLNLMQQVLLNQAEFIDVRYAGNTLAISELGGVSSYAYFYYMDLDGDGSYEVIVEGYPESDASIFSIIDEKVYRYDYSSRCDLYTDGTISSSGGASISHFSRITDFTPKGYVDDYIAIYDGSVWAEHPNTTYYTDFADGHYANEITEEEYNNIMSQYERIPAEKYDFSRENIEKIVIQ